MTYKIVGYGQTFALDKEPHGYEDVKVLVKPEFPSYEKATAFCEEMQKTAPRGLAFFVEGDGEPPTCPECGADHWDRERRIRENAHLTANGDWETYDDDYIEDDMYMCYECKTPATGIILQQLQEIN